MPAALLQPVLSRSDFVLENRTNPLQNVSFAFVSPLHPNIHCASSKDCNTKQSNGCKLNFLDAVRGDVNLDVKVGHVLQTNHNLLFLPPFLKSDCVIVSPSIEVFEEGCILWQSTLIGHFVGQKLPFPMVNYS
jgi:hypothetical protein